ncbi:MAG: branched-chain amino acid ABC transporter permease [Planctomycetota bacterium]|jgi:branched-chain amino acid transport system permease protein|nr:branched-chain amino acid ABC transporter permease [Planctomycetota bacterium]
MTRNRKMMIAVAAVLFYVVGVPWLCAGRNYYLGVVTTASVLAVICAGVWLIFYIGRINIGQGAFALAGGYAAAIAVSKWGLSFWIAMPFAGLASMAIGILIGLPLLRLKGVYFSMITLSLTETARLAAQSLKSITNGPNGILNIPLPRDLSIFGITVIPDFATVDKHLALFYLGAVLLVVTYAALYRIVNSRLGWLFRSLQQNEDLASSFGVNVPMLRVIAFAICTFLAGVGGAFFVAMQQSIYPATFAVQDSTYFMLYCFIGGLSFVFGPLIGTFILYMGFEVLQGFKEYQPLLYALLMIGVMLWLPNGLLSLRPPKFLSAKMPSRPASGGDV